MPERHIVDKVEPEARGKKKENVARREAPETGNGNAKSCEIGNCQSQKGSENGLITHHARDVQCLIDNLQYGRPSSHLFFVFFFNFEGPGLAFFLHHHHL